MKVWVVVRCQDGMDGTCCDPVSVRATERAAAMDERRRNATKASYEWFEWWPFEMPMPKVYVRVSPERGQDEERG